MSSGVGGRQAALLLGGASLTSFGVVYWSSAAIQSLTGIMAEATMEPSKRLAGVPPAASITFGIAGVLGTVTLLIAVPFLIASLASLLAGNRITRLTVIAVAVLFVGILGMTARAAVTIIVLCVQATRDRVAVPLTVITPGLILMANCIGLGFLVVWLVRQRQVTRASHAA
jgi:hypothetical protein